MTSGAPPGEHRPGARRGAWLATPAALAAACCLLFAPALLSDRQFLHRDAGRMHHPVKRWMAEELRRGHLPQWNPYAGMGVPVVAGAVDAPLHPFNGLLALLPFEVAFKAWVLVSVLAAGLGAATWARRLGQGAAGATVAGLAFMLSGFVVSSTDNLTYLSTLAAAPWLLAAAHAAAAGGGAARLLGVGAASFVTAAGGDPMGWAVATGLAALQALVLVEGVAAPRRAVRALGAVAVGVLAAAPVLLPVAAWIPHSSRAAAFAVGEYQRWNLHPLRLLELLVPHLVRGPTGSLYAEAFEVYAGNDVTSIPWVLSLYAGSATLALAALGARRDATARWLAIGALAFAWMAMGPHAGFGQLARHLPVLSSFRYWEKLAIWTTLLLAAAAGAGAERLLASPGEGRRLATLAGVTAALLLAMWGATAAAPQGLAGLLQVGDRRAAAAELVANLGEGTASAGTALALLAGVAWLLASGALRRGSAIALALVVALDLGAANVRAYVLMRPALVEEPSPIASRLAAGPGPARVITPFKTPHDRWPDLTQTENGWRWLARTGGAAWNVPRRFGNLDTYTGMFPARLARFRVATGPGRADLATPAALWGFGHVVVPGDPALAARVGLAPPHEVVAVDVDLPAFLVSQPSRPRVGLAGPLEQVGADEALAFALSPGAAASGRSVVEGAVPAGYRPPRGEARLLSDEGERLRIETTADGPALLVVNDAHAAGWWAEVDGRPADLLAVNYLARGVWLPPGPHAVELRYRTPGLVEGWGLLAVGALGLLLLTLRERRARSGAAAPA